MTALTDLTTCGLAACATVDLWLEGSIFATARANLEARGGRLAELASCRFCHSFHAAWISALLLAHGGGPGRALLAILAIQKLASLFHRVDERLANGMPKTGTDEDLSEDGPPSP
jgi:hypothetical protein